MSLTIKIIGTEAVCNSTSNSTSSFNANTRVVRLLETTGGTNNALITLKDSGANTLGTYTLRAGSEVVVQKARDQYLISNATTVVATSGAFSY